MARVSVVMPIYNAEMYLEKSIQSLMIQTYKDMEIILVDDGSTDKSPEIISKMMNKEGSHIKLCAMQNEGVSAARNLGFKLVSSEYVIFVDADDYVEPNFIEQHIESMQNTGVRRFMKEPNCSVASGYYVKIGEKPEKVKKVNAERIALFKNPAVWLRMFKTDFLRKNEIIFGNYAIAEDLNFTGKVHLLINPNFTLTKEPLYHYHIRKGSAVGISDERQFQLLTAVRDLEEFAKENDVYEQNEASLEFMVINHVLMAGMKRAGEGQMIDQAIDKIISFVEELHPQWYKNEFIEMYTDDEEKKYLEAVKQRDIMSIKKFASHY